MSIRRIVRYVLGVILAAILMAIILPLAGIPMSHMLPPAWIYAKATGQAKGVITTKYMDVTNNPFNVGGKQYFLIYKFRVKSPGPKGQPNAGPAKVYVGTMHLSHANKGVYDEVRTTVDSNTVEDAAPQQMIPTYITPVHIRYQLDYPDINGINAPWGARNIGPGSNNFSGWIIYLVVMLILGYLFMMLFERFTHNENL